MNNTSNLHLKLMLDLVDSHPHIEKHQPSKMVLPLDEYKRFFSQDPEATKSEDESAADPIPSGLKDIAESTKAAWSSSRDDAKDDMAALAEMAADACRKRRFSFCGCLPHAACPRLQHSR